MKMQLYSFVFVIISLILVINLESVSVIAIRYNNDSTQIQLPEFRMKTRGPEILTLSTGANVKIDDAIAINTRLSLNTFFIEYITEFVRERIPERVVHGKGVGVFGYFKVTHDISDICRVKVFNTVGRITPTLVRFSPANERVGGRDTARDIRGMAIKFYTEEGNLDMLNLNIEMFGIKDPVLFPAFARTFHRNPKTNVLDNNMIWDFISLRPETLHMHMRIFGDRGIPAGYRYMPAFPIHTFELLNKYGNRTFVKFHWLPDAGIRNLTTQQAQKIQANDTDFAVRDLYNAIHDENYPSWTLYVQTIAFKNIENFEFDIFDVTRTWPLKKIPLRPVGKLVLNKIPENQFASAELAVFNPAHLLDGIRGIDSIFEARVIAYRSAQNYRVSTRFNEVKVNCPLAGSTRKTYLRDGEPPVLDNAGELPNYYPNSFHGPLPEADINPPRLTVFTDPKPTNFDQASELYDEMNEGEKCRLVENILSLLSTTDARIQERTLYWYKVINKDLGRRLEYGLKYPKDQHPCPQL